MCDFESQYDDINLMPVEAVLIDPQLDNPILLHCTSKQRCLLDEVPDNLCVSKSRTFGGWQTTLRIARKNLEYVFAFVFGTDGPEIISVPGDENEIVELIGYWD